jgi:hypothetical protein
MESEQAAPDGLQASYFPSKNLTNGKKKNNVF